MDILSRTFVTQAPASTVLIRLIVGGTFLSSGIQKFFFMDDLGARRLGEIGIPCPEVAAPLLDWCQIGCGALLIFGLLTRFAAISTILYISLSVVATKIPILLGHAFWIFGLPQADSYGFWGMIHEARMDFATLLAGLFLLIVGAGYFSVDALLAEWHRTWDEKRTLSQPRALAGVDLETWV